MSKDNNNFFGDFPERPSRRQEQDDDFFSETPKPLRRREPQKRRPQPSSPGKKQRSVLSIVVTDFVIFAAALLVFALFHHVIPREMGGEPQKLPSATTTQQAQASPDVSSSTAAEPDISESSTASSEESGMWGAKFADKFADGEPEQTENSYKSKDLSIEIEKVTENDVTYYVADIYVRNLENFKTAFAQGKAGKGYAEATDKIARDNNAILAISGDYYGIREQGVVVRNGELYRETTFEDVLVMNNDGSMETFSPQDFDLDAIKQNGAWQVWSFGPMLLTDGKSMDEFNSNLNPKNPRSAIGYYEPGHYCFVLVDGRQEGYSVGMTLQELSQLFEDLGCQAAYNLDGGQSAEMAFMGELVNQPYNGGRSISDIIYIGEAEE